ncbi:MAG: hypothetical protein COA38_16580 [Fluviicola sp.]|nr:MAG: hypothetical protein COA38_16580 [Fluviicola sp.]
MKNILILSLCVLAIVGCRKKKDTLVEITVKNASSQIISGANVKLLTLPPYEPNSTPILELEGTTDINGVIRFNFNDVYHLGQAGVAVLNILVKKGDLEGTGIIKVEQEKTSKKVVLVL